MSPTLQICRHHFNHQMLKVTRMFSLSQFIFLQYANALLIQMAFVFLGGTFYSEQKHMLYHAFLGSSNCYRVFVCENNPRYSTMRGKFPALYLPVVTIVCTEKWLSKNVSRVSLSRRQNVCSEISQCAVLCEVLLEVGSEWLAKRRWRGRR